MIQYTCHPAGVFVFLCIGVGEAPATREHPPRVEPIPEAILGTVSFLGAASRSLLRFKTLCYALTGEFAGPRLADVWAIISGGSGSLAQPSSP